MSMKKAVRFILAAVSIYLLAHFFYTVFMDLTWLPPTDLSATDPPKKRNPDGPLVLRDDFLGDVASNGVISKAVLIPPPEEVFDVKAMDDEKTSAHRKKRPKISEKHLKEFRQRAKRVHRRTGWILFALVNHAYLNLTLNWLCNTYALSTGNKANKSKKIKNQFHDSLLIVALDSRSCAEIRKQWPKVECLVFDMGTEERKGLNEALSWGRVRYVQLLTLRANLAAALSEAKLPFVIIEMDAAWLRNPWTLFVESNRLEDADIVLPLNSAPSATAKGQRFAFDPMVVFPTNASRRLMQEMRRRLNRNPNLMDQDVLNELCASQYAGVVCREFSAGELTDGRWFKLSEKERMRAAAKAKEWPFIVNNNFYVGVENKMARQALNGLWFLTAKKHQCNLPKAQRILVKYAKAPP